MQSIHQSNSIKHLIKHSTLEALQPINTHYQSTFTINQHSLSINTHNQSNSRGYVSQRKGDDCSVTPYNDEVAGEKGATAALAVDEVVVVVVDEVIVVVVEVAVVVGGVEGSRGEVGMGVE